MGTGTVGNGEETAADRALWHAAQSVLSGSPDAEAQRRLRRQKIIRLCVGIGIGVAPLLGVAASLAVGHHPAHHRTQPNVPTWRWVLLWTLELVGLALAALSLLRMRRVKTFGSAWKAPQQVLTGRQRKHLLRQVEGKTPVDPRTLPLAHDLALRLSRLVGVAPLYTGLLCVLASQLVLGLSVPRLLYVAARTVLGVVTLIRIRTRVQRARRFLAAYPS